MPITDLLERNSKLYGDETALVEINPEVREEQRVTWKEYELIQPTGDAPYRRVDLHQGDLIAVQFAVALQQVGDRHCACSFLKAGGYPRNFIDFNR